VAYRTRHLQWNGLPTKFHTNLLIGTNGDGGGRHTDRGGDLISLHFCFRKESRLKIKSTVFELLYADRHIEGNKRIFAPSCQTRLKISYP
jgi:hypothetical protein